MRIKATVENMIFVSNYPGNWFTERFVTSDSMYEFLDAIEMIPSDIGKDYLMGYNGRICEGTLHAVSPYGEGVWLDFETKGDMMLFVLSHSEPR
jgi:hypothetical protein